MLICSVDVLLSQLEHKHLPPHFDFAILQNDTLQPLHYLFKHEKVLPHQTNGSNPILAEYGTDQISISNNGKGNDDIIKPLDSFSFKSVTPFQPKFKTPIEKHNKSLHQQSLLLKDTNIISDDEGHKHTRNPKDSTPLTPDTTIISKNFSTITKPKPDTHSTDALETQQPIKFSTHCSQIIPFYDPSFFKYKNCFQGFSYQTTTLQIY